MTDDGGTQNNLTLVRFYKLGLLNQLLHTVSSPAVAYLLFIIGLALLIFEFYTAGVGIAGVVGAACIILASYGLAALPYSDGTDMGIAELSIRRAGWVLVACLLAVGVVNVAVPQLEEIIADSSLPFIPEDAEANTTFETMDDAFGNGKTKSILYVVAERDGGLTDADRQYVKGLVPRLDDDHYVSSIQDVSDNRLLFDSLDEQGRRGRLLPGRDRRRHRRAGGEPLHRRASARSSATIRRADSTSR